MASYGIFQLKKPIFLLYLRPAKKQFCFSSRIADLPAVNNFRNIHPKKLVAFIFQPQAKGANIAVGATHSDDINGVRFCFHPLHLLCGYYSTFVRNYQEEISGCGQSENLVY
jgi:hypothetical protein